METLKKKITEAIHYQFYHNQGQIGSKIDIAANNITTIAVEFAKLHVKEALKEAYWNHKINTKNGHNEDICELDKDSILNAYPLNLIK